MSLSRILSLLLSTWFLMPEAALAQAGSARPAKAPPNPRTSASAGNGRGKSAKPVNRITLKEAKLLLQSTSVLELADGIEAMAVIATPAAAQALSRRVRDGLPPNLLSLAIRSYSAMSRGADPRVIRALTERRETDLRADSARLVGTLKMRSLEPRLIELLDDHQPRVRSAAVASLEKVGTRRALPQLFKAYERGAKEALRPAAKMARPQELKRVLAYVERDPLEQLTPAIEVILERKDVPMKTKEEMVQRALKRNSPAVPRVLQMAKQAKVSLPKDKA